MEPQDVAIILRMSEEIEKLQESVNKAIGIALTAREIAERKLIEPIPTLKSRRLEWARILAPGYLNYSYDMDVGLRTGAAYLDQAIDAMIKWEDEQG